MGFVPQQVEQLNAKLDIGAVKTRKQAGKTLSYVEGWHAIAEANRIFGHDAWDRETFDVRQLGEPYQTDTRDASGKVSGKVWRVAYGARCRITVRAGETVVIRDGSGYGSGIDRDLGSAHESAIKEAETDAMKRALMTFGNPFGLALYDKAQENVDRPGNGNGATHARPAESAPPPRPTNGAQHRAPPVAARQPDTHQRPTAAASAPRPPEGRLVLVDEDGAITTHVTGADWFRAFEAALTNATNPATVWGLNGKTAEEIVERAPPAAKAKAQGNFDQCMAIVDGAPSPMI